jgi:DNA recombination protein RmuC
MPDTLLSLLFLLLGLLTGALSAWLIAKFRLAAQHISPEEVEKKYVHRQVYDKLQEQADLLHSDLKEKEEDRLSLEKALAAKERDLLYLEEKLQAWKSDFEALQRKAHTEFENIANRLLEEKSQKFTARNEQQLNNLLHPLREKIKDFGLDIERRFTEEAKDKVSLKKEIEQLKDLNLQLSTDAQNLAAALKGDSKMQGNWGELQLELLLEKAGLQRGMHYEAQVSFKDENGQDKRPDFIIHLPDEKHLIVDSKVSLTAYEKFYNADNEELRSQHLLEHIASIRQHIRDLGSKNYQHLYQINSPDYLLLFIPIEPAFSVALQSDSRLFLDALDRNVVLVTTSTLLATMRTVSYIWRQERQKRNVIEIARQSGLLYDKFVAFVEDLKEIGLRLDYAQAAWHGAMNKLSESRKYGDTLIGRAQRIKELGAKASKALPGELLGDEDGDENSFG